MFYGRALSVTHGQALRLQPEVLPLNQGDPGGLLGFRVVRLRAMVVRFGLVSSERYHATTSDAKARLFLPVFEMNVFES